MERAFKYHGLGNDFVVLDRRASGKDVPPERARALCDRHRGIGADGVLVLLPVSGGAQPARMVVHNADGSRAEMCGNGARCAAMHLAGGRLHAVVKIDLATDAGVVSCVVERSGPRSSQVEVAMGHASFSWVDAPVPGREDLRGTAVSMGNPHLVLFDRPFEESTQLGPQLENLPAFPQRTNVEWARSDRGGFVAVIWERGVGLTDACGTGACAVVAAAVKTGRAEAGEWISVRVPGGELRVRMAPSGDLTLKGPAERVFDAELPE